MSYNPATDFLGLWRTVAGGVAKESMPGLDFSVSALGRLGLLNVSVSGTQPVVNQSTTAWFQPASPSYSAEGALQLWNGTAYVAATPQHFTELVLNSLSTTRGVIAFRGANTWQALAPGTLGYLLTSGGAGADPTWSTIGAIGGALDGITNTVGALTYRGAGGWAGTGAGAQWTVLNNSVANTPAWTSLSALIDGAIGSTRGALLERGAGSWALLAPGATAGYPLQSGGAGADPSWAPSFVPYASFTLANIAVLAVNTPTDSAPSLVTQAGMSPAISSNHITIDKTGVYAVTARGVISGVASGAGITNQYIQLNVSGGGGPTSGGPSYFSGAGAGVNYLNVTTILSLSLNDTLSVLFNGSYGTSQSVGSAALSIVRIA